MTGDMTCKKKQRQRVTPPKRHADVELVSVTEVTPENIDQILHRFSPGPGIYDQTFEDWI